MANYLLRAKVQMNTT